MNKPLLLVDAYSQIYRGYYAVRSLSTAEGVPTNALFAMAKLLLSLQEQYGAYDGAFVFDKGKCTKRTALLETYKSNRPPMPDDLKSQIEPLREMISFFGWPIIEQEGIEADDLIGAIARESKEETLILSSDKDLSQLVNDRIRMLVPDHNGKGYSIRDTKAVVEKFGVAPSGIVDYLSLIGDASDNIPGVDGVGPKTAASLVAQYGSIDGIYANLDRIKREALRNKLSESTERLCLNRKLIALDTEIATGDMELARTPPDLEKLRTMAEKYELKSILKELDKLSSSSSSEKSVCSCAVKEKESEKVSQMEFDF